MIKQHTISIATPILNEEFFLLGWLDCVLQFADQIVITDGGSTDNTFPMLMDCAIKHRDVEFDLRYKPQTGKPYTADWDEGAVRNELLSRCTGDFILLLDADELVIPADLDPVIERMESEQANRAMFKLIPFWGNTKQVRVNTEEDKHWLDVNIARLARRGECNYTGQPHHCPLHGQPVIDTDAGLYHMHYAFGPHRLKPNDNRRFDFDPDNAPPEDRPNVQIPSIRAYEGPWPHCEGLYG